MIKRRKGLKKNVKYFLFGLITILVMVGVCILLCNVLKDESINDVNEKKHTKEISGYGITIDDYDSEFYKSEYNKLKDILENKDINYEEYAKGIAKLFIIDLYTIDTKINKYDVGGVEEVLPDARDNYITNVTDTLYKYVEDNSKEDRVQDLPQVTSITCDNIESIKYKLNSEDKEYDGYKIKLTWTYLIDYGYDTEGEVIIINKDNLLYVVEKN